MAISGAARDFEAKYFEAKYFEAKYFAAKYFAAKYFAAKYFMSPFLAAGGPAVGVFIARACRAKIALARGRAAAVVRRRALGRPACSGP
jgi:hypothetical protein